LKLVREIKPVGKTSFHIVLNMRTCTGIQSFGRFFLGGSKDFADKLFSGLMGKNNVNDKTVLYLELMETYNDLPVNMNVISCTLEELALNCKMITKETFKLINLE
jgi:hypothetical protein